MSFVEFLMKYYFYILVVLIILIVGVIGFLVDSKSKDDNQDKKSKRKKDKTGDAEPLTSSDGTVSGSLNMENINMQQMAEMANGMPVNTNIGVGQNTDMVIANGMNNDVNNGIGNVTADSNISNNNMSLNQMVNDNGAYDVVKNYNDVNNIIGVQGVNPTMSNLQSQPIVEGQMMVQGMPSAESNQGIVNIGNMMGGANVASTTTNYGVMEQGVVPNNGISEQNLANNMALNSGLNQNGAIPVNYNNGMTMGENVTNPTPVTNLTSDVNVGMSVSQGQGMATGQSISPVVNVPMDSSGVSQAIQSQPSNVGMVGAGNQVPIPNMSNNVVPEMVGNQAYTNVMNQVNPNVGAALVQVIPPENPLAATTNSNMGVLAPVGGMEQNAYSNSAMNNQNVQNNGQVVNVGNQAFDINSMFSNNQ